MTDAPATLTAMTQTYEILTEEEAKQTQEMHIKDKKSWWHFRMEASKIRPKSSPKASQNAPQIHLGTLPGTRPEKSVLITL